MSAGPVTHAPAPKDVSTFRALGRAFLKRGRALCRQNGATTRDADGSTTPHDFLCTTTTANISCHRCAQLLRDAGIVQTTPAAVTARLNRGRS